MGRSLPFVLAVLLATSIRLPTVAAQAPAGQSSASPSVFVQYVRVEGADYMFHLPSTIQPGLTVFDLVNVGRDVHAMTVLLLPANKTIHQFLEAFMPSGRIPAWATVLAASGTVKPGAEAFVTLRLKPGRYVLACLIPASDGRSHTEKGMVQVVNVK